MYYKSARCVKETTLFMHMHAAVWLDCSDCKSLIMHRYNNVQYIMIKSYNPYIDQVCITKMLVKGVVMYMELDLYLHTNKTNDYMQETLFNIQYLY